MNLFLNQEKKEYEKTGCPLPFSHGVIKSFPYRIWNLIKELDLEQQLQSDLIYLPGLDCLIHLLDYVFSYDQTLQAYVFWKGNELLSLSNRLKNRQEEVEKAQVQSVILCYPDPRLQQTFLYNYENSGKMAPDDPAFICETQLEEVLRFMKDMRQ